MGISPVTAQHSPPIIRVLIVSEVRLYREGLARALAAYPELDVVEAVARDALVKLRTSEPHILLADATIVRSTNLVAIAAESGARVVAFAVVEDDEKEVLACAEAGVAGFVARDAPMMELLTTVRTACAGEVRCSPRIAQLLVRRVVTAANSEVRSCDALDLTHRQRDILALLAHGMSNKEIAIRLKLELNTVKNHVHDVLRRLKVRRRGEAAAVARAVASTASERAILNPSV